MFDLTVTGYHTKNLDCDTIYRPKGNGEFLFLLILSPMHFYFDHKERLASPGACILYAPGYTQHYTAEKEFFNSFIHFKYHPDFLSEYAIPTNQIFYPEEIEEINWFLKKIHYEFCMQSLHSHRMCESYCHQLFITLTRSLYKQHHPLTQNTDLLALFDQLRLHLISSCEEDWSIQRMCEFVNLEKSQLYTYYHALFKTTPKSDLIHARIDRAKYLLTNEAMQIKQVSQASGFNNIYHFSRYFKQICGCAPSDYTKNKKVP